VQGYASPMPSGCFKPHERQPCHHATPYMMYVATDYGIVTLKGKSVPERSKAQISIAHPAWIF
jgi:acyl-CoA hydrolase